MPDLPSRDDLLRVGDAVVKGKEPTPQPAKREAAPVQAARPAPSAAARPAPAVAAKPAPAPAPTAPRVQPRPKQSPVLGALLLIGLGAGLGYALFGQKPAAPAPAPVAITPAPAAAPIPAPAPVAPPLPPVVAQADAAPVPVPATAPAEEPARPPAPGGYASSIESMRREQVATAPPPVEPPPGPVQSLDLPPPLQHLRVTITEDKRPSDIERFDVQVESRARGKPAILAYARGLITDEVAAFASVQDAGIRVLSADTEGAFLAVMIRHKSWEPDVAMPQLIVFKTWDKSLRRITINTKPTRITAATSVASFVNVNKLVYKIVSETAEGGTRWDFYSPDTKLAGGFLCDIQLTPGGAPRDSCERLGYRFASQAR